MATTLSCFVCNSCFGDLDSPIYCDSFSQPAHTKCTGLSSTEIKCLALKNRNLKYFCISCDKGLKELPDLKQLIKMLITDVEDLKVKLQKTDTTTSFDNDFIINEIADRNARASNLIFYNVTENESNQVEVRITHDLEQVNSCIRSIISEADARPVPVKAIRLGRYRNDNKPRPLKIIFSSPADAFDVIKCKHKLSRQNLPSKITISSDRTQLQRDSMNKLRNELNQRLPSEPDLTIKFIRGVPKIVLKEKKEQNF